MTRKFANLLTGICCLCLQITVTKTYNVTNLFEDIKSLYKIAGFKGQSVCFLFTDAEVKDEGFLEYINQILMTGVQCTCPWINKLID